MELTDAQKDAITQAIYTGRKIEAIKLYRESTGKGLREAKDFIEAVTERLREEDPDRVSPTAKGCGTSVLVLFILLGTLGALLR